MSSTIDSNTNSLRKFEIESTIKRLEKETLGVFDSQFSLDLLYHRKHPAIEASSADTPIKFIPMARHENSLSNENAQKRFEKETLCVFVLRECLWDAQKSFEKETLSKSTRELHHEKGVFRRQIDHKFAPTILVDLLMTDDSSNNIMEICGISKIKSLPNDQI
jgi:hypothetical protein